MSTDSATGSIIVSERLTFLTTSGGIAAAQATFRDLLAVAGLTKQDLANELGVWPETVSRWSEVPPPYAIAYLELLIENDVLRSKLNGDAPPAAS